MLTVEDLIAIEEIKQLKARYFRSVDTMNMDSWLQCFTEDADLTFELSVRPSKDQEVETARFTGKAELEGWWNGLSRKQTVHHGHMPEITIVSDNEASGIWAMEDIVEFSDGLLWGYGHYHEKYRRIDGEWKIARLHLTRTRVSHTKRDTSFL
jgi:hypothetical protein